MSLIFLHYDVKGVGFFKVVYSTTYVLNARIYPGFLYFDNPAAF
jgi:hypothetical protein